MQIAHIQESVPHYCLSEFLPKLTEAEQNLFAEVTKAVARAEAAWSKVARNGDDRVHAAGAAARANPCDETFAEMENALLMRPTQSEFWNACRDCVAGFRNEQEDRLIPTVNRVLDATEDSLRTSSAAHEKSLEGSPFKSDVDAEFAAKRLAATIAHIQELRNRAKDEHQGLALIREWYGTPGGKRS